MDGPRKRCPHLLYPCKPGAVQKRWLVVECDGGPVPHKDRPAVITERLERWKARELVRQTNGTWTSTTFSGKDGTGFATCLAALTHNTGGFALLSHNCSRIWNVLDVWRKVESGSYTLASAIVLEDPPNLLVFSKPKGLVWFDARNWCADGYPEQGTIYERLDYLVALCTGVCGVHDRLGWGRVALSVGAQAAHIFRAKHLRHPVHANASTRAGGLEGSALYGGRCECFRVGRLPGEVYHVDFRSLYPSICVRDSLPCALVATGIGSPPIPSGVGRERLCLCAEVSVGTDSPDYPYRRGNEVVYPVGRWRAAYWQPELTHMLEHNRVLAWHSWALYRCAPVLKSYMEEVYALRCELEKQDHDGLLGWAKALLVSCVGKFAQRDRSWQTVPDPTAPPMYGGWYVRGRGGRLTRYRSVAGVVQKEVIGGWSYDAVPSVTGFVASSGRIQLLRALDSAGRDSVYYCDTDSLLVGAEGYGRLRADGLLGTGEFGRLRLLSRHANAWVWGVKHYQLSGRLVCAGLPKGAQRYARDVGQRWLYEGPGAACWEGRRPDGRAVLTSYARRAKYNHGRVLPNGHVEPFIVCDRLLDQEVRHDAERDPSAR